MLSVLKMSFILLFLTLFQAVATNSYSQSVTISVKTDQAPLTDLFAIIEKQSDFLFFYVDSDVKNVKVSVNATDKSIENILSQALRNTSLKYSIEGRNINVFNKNIVAQQTKKRITGVVKDPEGNAIIGANVIVKGTTNGTITDMDGILILFYFSFLSIVWENIFFIFCLLSIHSGKRFNFPFFNIPGTKFTSCSM